MDKRKILKELLIKYALHIRPVMLSSGKKSNYYIDVRAVSTSSLAAPIIADLMKEMIGDVDAVGGPPIGAVPILGALAGKGYYRTFIVRKEPKQYGLSKWIEGLLTEEDRKVAIIDDVATTGSSLLRAINVVKEQFPGIEVVKVVVVVDREEGAEENLKRFGYRLESIFKAKELIESKLN